MMVRFGQQEPIKFRWNALRLTTGDGERRKELVETVGSLYDL